MSDSSRSGLPGKKARRRLSLEESVVVVPGYATAPLVRATSDLRTPDSSERQSPMPGVPEPIHAAAWRYWTAREERARQGLSEVAANMLILEEAEAEGGVARPDETVNLSMWSERLSIPRPILEALVLAAYRSRAVPQRAPFPSMVEGRSSDADPWTPCPAGMRQPPAEPPSSRQHQP